MDKTLAELYGTNVETQDAEKLAAAQLAEELAEDGQVNLDGLDSEDIEALAQQVLEGSSDEAAGDETDEQSVAGDETQEKQSAAEKLAEFDYYGRVMAHAYVQELKNIEKQASEMPAESYGGMGKTTKHKMKEMAGKITGAPKKALEAAKSGAGSAANAAAFAAGHEINKFKGLSGGGKAKYVAGKAGKLGLAGLAAYGAKKALEKKSAAEGEQEISALDRLAIQRAQEMIAASGLDKQSSINEQQAEVLQAAVEARAMELLRAEGYTFEGDETEQGE